MEPDKNPAEPSSPWADLVGRDVVIDTAGSIVYIGRLLAVTPDGFWMAETDMHDCDEGHALKDEYLMDARINGIRVNRYRIFVMRATAISVSALDDVALE
jgi:hypothetical protein